ncbi:MAG: DoxX family protein [Deltaproteobacteria bacterium]|nr:DoxX family protein [Deltaproteobacteria bacterium]
MSKLSRLLPTAARSLLGLTFVVFGLNGFLHFLPQPPLPEAALPFLGGLAKAGYFFPLLKGLEVLAGVLLLSGRFVPLALAVLAPIIVNIAAFHLILAPSFGMVALLVGLEVYLAWSYRDAFAPMLRARVAPTTAPASLRDGAIGGSTGATTAA